MLDNLTGLIALSPDGLTRQNMLLRTVCARALGLEPLPSEETSEPSSGTEPMLAAVAEQFSTDVTGVSVQQRGALVAAFGAEVLSVASLMFVADFVPRVRAGLGALGVEFADPDGWDDATHPADALLNRFTGAVGALRGLDPLITELIRLRGAVQHNCRLCRSLRESTALEAGGSESLYADIEAYQSSARLTEAHKAALGYVDALIWTPAAVGGAAAAVLEHFSAEQAVEITLDVMRNATNKIAVALGGDEPRVAEGTELYRLGDDGVPVFSS
ncbi:carboxymuconolactone decarboxylase family protein [Mycolicibacterium neoaurum]|uniref:carboxymuconolactone decarboxylase family protein n=1 Tax=Mycolicibacterium neoaurum TaxID=1795 RepID=UPI001BCBA488|nr:carboxymuconolactone decarboxylase family protein [Mycolicibacterium neoaurum]QVI30076.1 carboxymuconolactone decarboxylase family protein [Mycolicibacterium neoaurum]